MHRLAASALLVAMAVVVVASAWLRLNGPRADCGAWPLCRFEQRVEAVDRSTPAAPAANGAVRALHRVAASGALLLIVALAVSAWRRHDRAALRRLAVLLALALALSALGIATPGSRSSAVMLGNLLGGAAMFALSWVLWRGQRGAAALPRRLRHAASALALAWVAQAALGALSGAAVGAVATLVHLLLAFGLAIGLVVFALALRRAGQVPDSNAMFALLALQVALGLAAAFGAAAPPFVLVHNLGAALGLALLLGRSIGPYAEPTAA